MVSTSLGKALDYAVRFLELACFFPHRVSMLHPIAAHQCAEELTKASPGTPHGDPNEPRNFQPAMLILVSPSHIGSKPCATIQDKALVRNLG